VAGFFNDLFQCYRHGADHTMFRVWVQPRFRVRFAARANTPRNGLLKAATRSMASASLAAWTKA
jgi:hypothetical protein